MKTLLTTILFICLTSYTFGQRVEIIFEGYENYQVVSEDHNVELFFGNYQYDGTCFVYKDFKGQIITIATENNRYYIEMPIAKETLEYSCEEIQNTLYWYSYDTGRTSQQLNQEIKKL